MPPAAPPRASPLDGKVVLLTGGTGSFGRRFAEVALREHRPRKVIVYSRDELKQHEMRTGGFDHPALRYFIGDVRDGERLRRAMEGVDVVVHAAALKQVPTCEYNPFEAVKTNILGAKNVIDAALDCEVERVVAISTDKAVNPINLYGATKLVSEKMFVQGNAYSGLRQTRFACVRYGNVVGSRGSVIPLFLKQRGSGKVTVTDLRMTRFWITLDQGVRFVLRALAEMRGGEVFIPKIPSMRITDLVEAVAPGAKVEVVGIRPGEKLDEVLVSEDEARHTVDVDGMYVILPESPSWEYRGWPEARPVGEGFRFASDNNRAWLQGDELRSMVKELEADSARAAAR